MKCNLLRFLEKLFLGGEKRKSHIIVKYFSRYTEYLKTKMVTKHNFYFMFILLF